MRMYIGALCLVMLLAGCGTNLSKDDAKGQQVLATDAKQVKSAVVEKKEKHISVATAAKKARYTFNMERSGKAYLLYMYADKEKVSVTADDWACARKGDKVYSGNYNLAVAEKNAQTATVLPIGKQTFQIPNDGVAVVPGKPDLLVVSHCEASDLYSATVYVLNASGKPVQVQAESGEALVMNTTPQLIKSSGEGTYQSAVFSNASDPNWAFYNWRLEPKDNQLKLVKKLEPSKTKQIDVTEWVQNPDYLVKP